MSPIYIGAVALLVLAQLAVPKHLGFLPLIIAGCHLGNAEILPELTPARLLIIIGLGRAIAGGFMIWPSTKSRLDVLFILFSFFAVLSTLGHKADQWIPSPFNARVGLVINVCGAYLYARAYLPDITAFRRYIFLLLIVLIPLAVAMTVEQRTRRNLYFKLGVNSGSAVLREDKVRAKGPFRHPILAGTAGATALPFAYLLWRMGRRKHAAIGAAACLGVVLACASSGPLSAVAVSIAAMVGWRWRQHLKWVLWGGLAFALFFVLYSGRGPWYLMASIDLVGGSTGWHRAKLIDQGYVHLGEWWLYGTDYTRHWMASGMRWNPNHIDITNYYLHLGIIGGLPLMLCLMWSLVTAFRMLIHRMAELRVTGDSDEIVLWCAVASLAAHAISFVAISYFDQMYIFFYMLLGAIPGLISSPSSLAAIPAPEPPADEPIPVQPLRYYS